METKVVVRGVEDPAPLRDYAEARLVKSLARFDRSVLSVTMRLSDETGPQKKGVDKLCSIEVKLRTGEVRIKERCDDFEGSVNLALDRMRAALSREVSKRKRGVAEG
jgi:ribosomal subunit interface protein